jgi:hypothetical protein
MMVIRFPSFGVEKLRSHLKRFAKAKVTTGLPSIGLILYAVLAYALQFRWLRLARVVGEILQRFYSSNYSVNSALALVYSQLWNPVDECKVLMKLAATNRHDIDLLARAGLSSAYAGDLSSLQMLRDMAPSQELALASYLNGLVAFLKGQLNYHEHFQKSANAFFAVSGNTSPVASRLLMVEPGVQNSQREPAIPEYVRMAYNVRPISNVNELLTGDNATGSVLTQSNLTGGGMIAPGDGVRCPIVLIACDDGYLKVFGDYVIRTLRQENQNVVHFHVLTTDTAAAHENLVKLLGKYPNIRYSIEQLDGKSKTYITLSRYLICRHLLTLYNNDILISDVDMNLDFDLQPLVSQIKLGGYDFALCDVGYAVPWAKFAAGFSYFRVNNQATSAYLTLLSGYMSKLYANGGFWTMDQTGMLMAYEELQSQGHSFRMLNLHDVVDFKRLISMPTRLQRQKIKSKFHGGAPQ